MQVHACMHGTNDCTTSRDHQVRILSLPKSASAACMHACMHGSCMHGCVYVRSIRQTWRPTESRSYHFIHSPARWLTYRLRRYGSSLEPIDWQLAIFYCMLPCTYIYMHSPASYNFISYMHHACMQYRFDSWILKFLYRVLWPSARIRRREYITK